MQKLLYHQQNEENNLIRGYIHVIDPQKEKVLGSTPTLAEHQLM